MYSILQVIVINFCVGFTASYLLLSLVDYLVDRRRNSESLADLHKCQNFYRAINRR